MHQPAQNLTPSHLQSEGHSAANARALGSEQADSFKSHWHATQVNTTVLKAADGSGTFWQDSKGTGDTGSTGGIETRGRNTALHPRIFL